MAAEGAGAFAPREGQRLIAFYDERPAKGVAVHGVDQLPISEAQNFRVQGPAMVKVVYITHPSDDRNLVPFAEYDELLVRDKFNEALRIFNTLGASRVVAKAMRGDVSRAQGTVRAQGGRARFGAAKDSTWDVAYQSSGKGGPAADPRPLAYPQEPGFDAVCDAVLKNGAKTMKLEIVRHSQFSLDGELALGLRKAGFKLGLAGEKTRYGMFVIEATFGRDLSNVPDEEPVTPADAEPPQPKWAPRLRRR